MNPEDVRRALVVGAGAMGHGIAIVYAMSGRAVDLVDREIGVLDRARERDPLDARDARRRGRGARASDAPRSRPVSRLTNDLEAVALHADMATEAILEDPAEKKDLFVRLDGLLRPGTLIASNTSGLDVFSLAEAAIPSRLDMLIIHHYFLPPPIMPLVEVVRGAPDVARYGRVLGATARITRPGPCGPRSLL